MHSSLISLSPCVRAPFFFPFIYEWNFPLLLVRFPNQLPFGLTKVRRGPCLPPPPSQEGGNTHTETHQWKWVKIWRRRKMQKVGNLWRVCFCGENYAILTVFILQRTGRCSTVKEVFKKQRQSKVFPRDKHPSVWPKPTHRFVFFLQKNIYWFCPVIMCLYIGQQHPVPLTVNLIFGTAQWK